VDKVFKKVALGCKKLLPPMNIDHFVSSLLASGFGPNKNQCV